MQPRLESSKKYTAMPSELLQQIRGIFEETFSKHMANAKILVDGRIYKNEILFRSGYLEEGRLKQNNFEVSLEYDPKKQNALKMIHFVIDCAGAMMESFFEADKSLEDFPVLWQEFESQGKTAHIRVHTENSELEARADRLLGVSEDEGGELIHGEDMEEDRQALVTMLGLGDAEEDPEDA